MSGYHSFGASLAKSIRVNTETSDEALLAAIAAKDAAAMSMLYDRYAATVCGLANQIVRDCHLAQDVAHETFLAVWSRAGSYRPERGDARTWLLSIARHRAVDRVRRARVCVDIDDAVVGAADDDVWTTTARNLDRESIRAALAELPAEQRQAIEQAFFGGRTHTEIAASTGVPLGTVKGRLRLGLLRLRRRLEAAAQAPEERATYPVLLAATARA